MRIIRTRWLRSVRFARSRGGLRKRSRSLERRMPRCLGQTRSSDNSRPSWCAREPQARQTLGSRNSGLARRPGAASGLVIFHALRGDLDRASKWAELAIEAAGHAVRSELGAVPPAHSLVARPSETDESAGLKPALAIGSFRVMLFQGCAVTRLCTLDQ